MKQRIGCATGILKNIGDNVNKNKYITKETKVKIFQELYTSVGKLRPQHIISMQIKPNQARVPPLLKCPIRTHRSQRLSPFVLNKDEGFLD